MLAGQFTLAVAAGKGGTGKTLVSTSLALALARDDPGRVQLADFDVEEPNADLLLHPQDLRETAVRVRVPHVEEARCSACGKCAAACRFGALALMRRRMAFFPALCIGCGACAFVCSEDAIAEEEREVGGLLFGVAEGCLEFVQGRIHVGEQRVTPVLEAVKEALLPGAVRILDAPPGTACPMQETVAAADYCLLVTEPTPFGRHDLAAAVETCRALGVPCGAVLNRAGVGDRGIHDYCAQEGLPLLLEIPWQRSIAEAYARGKTLVDAEPQWVGPLQALYRTVESSVERG